MRKAWLLSAIVLAAVLSIVAVSIAATPRIREETRIRVVEHANTDKVVDIGRAGDSTGDVLTFHNPVYDAANDHRVGSDQGVCIRISPREGTWQCRWITWIQGSGAITVEGVFNDNRETVLAVTGGTGMFRNARGTMRLGFRKSASEFDFIFALIP